MSSYRILLASLLVPAGAILGIYTTVVIVGLTVLRYLFRSENPAKKAAILNELGIDAPASAKLFVGFFHPYCNAGGGGERVLWTAVKHLQKTSPDAISVIYTGDYVNKDEIIEKVKTRFGITLLPESLHIAHLKSRGAVEESTWPRFTLIGQSIGSLLLAGEAMGQLIPDIYIDTMGFAFTFHVVKAIAPSGTPLGAYVHYPTISTNMLQRVKTRQTGVENTKGVASSSVLSYLKLQYYRVFAWLYALSLRRASYIMVNSSWTKNHVDALLASVRPRHSKATTATGASKKYELSESEEKEAHVVYPPCDTESLTRFPLEGRPRFILSLAQFRPEKDHKTQLVAMHELLKMKPEYREGSQKITLVLMGGTRNDKDATRVERLTKLAKDLKVEDNVKFVVNAPYADLQTWLSTASIGLNTMVDEHFGINVVEFMAAGLIPVVHASGGPEQDIVIPYRGEPTGFHAKSPQDFAEALDKALCLGKGEALAMRRRARALAVERFSEEEFVVGWDVGWTELVNMREEGLGK